MYTGSGFFLGNAQIDTTAFQVSTQAKEFALEAERNILKRTGYKTMHYPIVNILIVFKNECEL